MAKLRVSSEVLLVALFPYRDLLTLRDAKFDALRGMLVLELTGHGVPTDAEEIIAEISIERRTTRFKPVPMRRT